MLLLTFQSAGALYGVDAAGVVSVIPRVRLRVLPHAPAFLAGVFEYRGEVVSVVDLGVLLGSAPSPDRLSTRIILADRAFRAQEAASANAPRRSLLGLIVEDAGDFATIDPAALTPPAAPILKAPYLGDITETDRGLIQLILPEKILAPPPEA